MINLLHELLLLLALATTAAAAVQNHTLDIPGRHQWPDRDGYCGANSIQMNALNFGSWISQRIVRQSVTNGKCGGGGDGNEILHTNVPCVLNELRFNHTAWDYHNQPKPQSTNYLIWVKKQLASGYPVIMFIFCKGDSHRSHGSEKGFGNYDHIEPIVGVLSNHSMELNSKELETWYPDDILVHHSDWDQKFYYRPFHTMADDTSMNGNCKNVLPIGGGPNEAYPCIPKEIDYGYALTGRFDPLGVTYPVHLSVNNWKEPDVVEGEKPIGLIGTIKISQLKMGIKYDIFRYDNYRNVPIDGHFSQGNFTSKYSFVAGSDRFTWVDPKLIESDGSTYYYCVVGIADGTENVTVDSVQTPITPPVQGPGDWPTTFTINITTNLSWSVEAEPTSSVKGFLWYDASQNVQRIDHQSNGFECFHFYNSHHGCTLIMNKNGTYRILPLPLPKGQPECCLDMPSIGAPPIDWATKDNPVKSNQSDVRVPYSNYLTDLFQYPSSGPCNERGSGSDSGCHSYNVIEQDRLPNTIPVLFTFPANEGKQDYYFWPNTMKVSNEPLPSSIFQLPPGCAETACPSSSKRRTVGLFSNLKK
jgi:hypothetical protein